MFLCKCATFLAHFCDFASVWLIVLVGFERLTLLYRVSFRRSLVNAKRHVFFLLLLSGFANLWLAGKNGNIISIKGFFLWRKSTNSVDAISRQIMSIFIMCVSFNLVFLFRLDLSEF
jgi:hypothetical protein